MPEASLERVASAVGTLASETRSLVSEVRTDNAGRKRQNRLLILMVALVLVGVLTNALQVVRQRADTAERSQVASDQRAAQLALAEQINDCLNPAGVCYQRSQKRQAALIAQLVQGVIAVNRCGAVAGTDVKAYDACIKAAGLPAPTASP